MGYSYLGENKWKDVTRDERTFCMYLFSIFKNDPKELVQIINSSSTLNGYNEKSDPIDENKEWELAYEVCFYRDALLQFGKQVKRDGDTFLNKSCGVVEPAKLIKRTFDLCLFSEDEIVIIEVKAAESLYKGQFFDFIKDCRELKLEDMSTTKGNVKTDSNSVKDGNYIEKIFLALSREFPEKNIKIPNVKLVLLASSFYYKSPSFTRKKGIGKEFIIDKREVDAVVSWFDIWSALVKSKRNIIGKDLIMILRADASYAGRKKEGEVLNKRSIHV